MSTEQSLDPHLIEETRQQIRGLVNEIAQLSRLESAPEEFHGEFLPRVVSALAAMGGAVWTLEDQGRLALAYQINLQQTRLQENKEDQARHGRLLQKALAAEEGMLVPPQSGAAGDDQAANPTDFLLVLGPVKTDVEVVGVVEIFQRPGAGPATQKGYLRFLLQMCELAGDFFKSRKLRHFTDRQVMWTQLEEFTRMVHASLEPREAAFTIANEGRRLIECDRVSVAISRGRKCRIEAVSGQDLFDKRSNTVRLLGQLATAVVAGGEPVWYTGDTSDMAPQIEDAVQEYVDESHTKMVAVLPLVRPRPEPSDEKEEQFQRENPEKPIGALVVEQIEDSRVPEKMFQRVEVVTRHSGTALANAMEHHSLFLLPLWRMLGKMRWVLTARTLPKTLAILGVVLAAILALVFVPADFELQGDGTLEPVEKRNVFADIEGVVEEIPEEVRHGSIVKTGQLLARLRNVDLDVAIEEVLGRVTTTGRDLAEMHREISVAQSVGERERLMRRRIELQTTLNSLKEQLKLYRKKEEKLEIRSPIDGQVITWDVYNLLIHRPVQRGQEVMRIADPEGEWQLEIQMPENRIGHIARAQREIQPDLDVEYILATEPGTKRYGKVKEVHLAAEVRGEEGNTVLIKVAIDTEQLKEEQPQLRPGAGVKARVRCGRRAIGYVWFHDAVAWVQSRILFRWF